MLPIQDINGDSAELTNITSFSRSRKVNGENTISFDLVPDDHTKEAYDMADFESVITFDDVDYIIKEVNQSNWGTRTRKSVDAVHEFFVHMIGRIQHDMHSGSITFVNALNRVFDPTDYDYQITSGTFPSERFENFGRENCLALFETVLDRFEAEFTVSGGMVFIRDQIGSQRDFQYRYKHNITSISRDGSTRNLATVIRGYGGEEDEDGNFPVEEEYRSPHISALGEIEADPVYHQNITTSDGMKDRLERDLIDEPEITVTVSIAELGINEARPGDWGFIIYEPMDLKVEARVVEVDEEFKFINGRWEAVDIQVTISNIKEVASDAMTRFEQTSKQMDRIMDGRDKIPNSALDKMFKLATDAINNARTELEFPEGQGIVARDKDDPNNIVRFNSGGLGVSDNGGYSYLAAITGYGVVAEVVTAGLLEGNYILGAYIEGSEIRGGEIIQESGSVRLEMQNGRLYSYVDEDLTMVYGRYDLEFFNRENEPIGKLTPLTNVQDPSLRGLGMEIDNDFFLIGIRGGEENVVHSTFRSSIDSQETVVAGPYIRNNGSDGSGLVLLANTYLRSSDSPTYIYDQPSIVMRQGRYENDMMLYYGGWNRRDDAVMEMRHRTSSESSTARLRLTADGVELLGEVKVNGTVIS